MTLNYRMMVESYPNLKEEIGDWIPGCEFSSLRDGKTCQVVNCFACFGVGLSTFWLQKKNYGHKIVYFSKATIFSFIWWIVQTPQINDEWSLHCLGGLGPSKKYIYLCQPKWACWTTLTMVYKVLAFKALTLFHLGSLIWGAW